MSKASNAALKAAKRQAAQAQRRLLLATLDLAEIALRPDAADDLRAKVHERVSSTIREVRASSTVSVWLPMSQVAS